MLLPFLNGFSNSDSVFKGNGSTKQEIADLITASPDDGNLYFERAKVCGDLKTSLTLYPIVTRRIRGTSLAGG